MLLFLFLGPISQSQADTLRLVYPEAPKSLDPHQYPPDLAARPIIMTAYRRLFVLKPGSVELDTSEKSESLAYTVRVSDDGRIYTVVMRPGLTFVDGYPVDSKAALFTFDRLMTTEAGQHFFPHLTGFEIVGDYTFRLILDAPWPPMVAALALPQASFISPGLSEKSQGYLNSHTLGSARLTVDDWDQNGLIMVNRSDLPTRPDLDRVEFFFAPDPKTRYELMAEKRAHLAVAPALDESGNNLALLEMPSYKTHVLAFNCEGPYTSQTEVRQALALLVEEAFGDKKIKPQGFLPAGFFPGLASQDKPEGHGRIRELLGRHKILGPLNLVYRQDDIGAYEDAKRLAVQFGEMSVSLNLVPMVGAAGQGLLENGDFDLYLFVQEPEIPSPEMWLGSLLDSRSSMTSNPARFKNTMADRLIDAFSAAEERSQRYQRIRELAGLALMERPYVLLYQDSENILVDGRLSSLVTHPMWPEVWPIYQTSLNPFKEQGKQIPKNIPQPEVGMEFDEPVAEPWE